MNTQCIKGLCYVCCLLLSIGLYGQGTIIVENVYFIADGNADVEEYESGEMYMGSTDLEFTEDPDAIGAQTIGLHFENIQLDADATISEVYLQFTTDEVSTGDVDLTISAEAVANASEFATTDFHLSQKTLTTAAINWQPVNWTIEDQSEVTQRTLDLSPIIQELIDQSDWASGNAINFIITGTGRRAAHAFEGEPSMAARLVIKLEQEVLDGDLDNIFINELMASNNSLADEFGEQDDWLEIYNGNDLPVLMDGLYLSDDINDLTKHQITEPLVLDANGFALFWLDDTPEQGAYHVPFKLTSEGETIFLTQMQNGALVILDEVAFAAQTPDVSYGRLTDGASEWVFFGEPTPDSSNNGAGQFLDATVDFSIDGGVFTSGLLLAMTCSDPDAAIRYTLNSMPPTSTSTLYSGPINLTTTKLVRAAAFKPGYVGVQEKSEIYIINHDHELPILQVTIEPELLFSDEQGMYVTGTNGVTGFCSFDPHNWNQEWEQPAKLRYFERNGDLGFEVNAGLKIGGGCSRGFSMKPFNFFMRGSEYGDARIEYPLFGGSDITSFKRFKLRNSGNDFALTLIRDAALTSMLQGQVDIDMLSYEPIVLYLNDDYWGYYGMREFFNKHWIESHHGVDPDNIDYIKIPFAWRQIKEGDDVALNELTEFIDNNSLASGQAYAHVADRLDINEMINYFIAEIYLANYDWPGNNMGIWRSKDNGKFRFMLYDMDISSGYAWWSPTDATFDGIGHATYQLGDGWPNPPASTLFLRKLLENSSFKNEFSQRTCTFAQTIFEEARANHFIDSLSLKIASEIPRMNQKWNNAPNDWMLWVDQPVGGSMNTWNAYLDDFRTFFADRFTFVLSNYQSQFNFAGNHELHINVNATTHGSVVLHSNEMAIPYQYRGRYFNNVPMRIKAIPEEGYQFVRWEETGETNPILSYTSSSNNTLTPIFIEEEVIVPPPVEPESVFKVYPIPATDALTLEYQEIQTIPFDIAIYNALGQLMHTQQLIALKDSQKEFIDVSAWPVGVYFLETVIGEKEVLVKLLVE